MVAAGRIEKCFPKSQAYFHNIISDTDYCETFTRVTIYSVWTKAFVTESQCIIFTSVKYSLMSESEKKK